MSSITFCELRYSAQKSTRNEAARAVLWRLTARISVSNPAVEVAENHGAIQADLEKVGMPIGSDGQWIAAHARALGVTLVTHDTGGHERVAGLSVANWAA